MKRLFGLLAWVALVTTLLTCGRGGEGSKTLHVFTWSDYFSDAAIQTFEKEFQAKVSLDTYENNEDLVAKLQTGVTGYDIVVPSDYAVKQLVDLKLLQPLDKRNIPNLRNLDARFLNQYYDPGNVYSVPYLWGTAGIGYDATKVNPAPTSWAVLWDKRYANHINMLDDPRETFAVALKRLGYSVNTTNPTEIEAAKKLLIEQKPLVRSYTTETDTLMVSEQVVLTHAWSGDVLRVAADNPNWKYVIPQEGSTLFIDNIAIPVGAPNKKLAEQFIDFILRPEIIAGVTAFTHYANCVPASRAYLPEALQNDPTIFPPEETLRNLESLRDVGDALKLYGDAWTAVKSAR